MADQILPEGIRFFPKNDKAPDFVIGTLVVTLDDLAAFFANRPELLTEYKDKKQLKLQLLKSKDGKLYAAVDTFKPTPKVINNSLPGEDEQPLPF
jgi:hypothetical protein